MTLSLTDIRLTYPDGDRRLTALDDVSLNVDRGELVAVTGPSGSGKSSLLAVAGVLVTPDSGKVAVGDTAVTALGGRHRDRIRRERIGFVFQQSNLLSSLTALDQLLLVSHLGGEKGAASKRRAGELLERVGLADKAARRPHQLSGGERQRVGIARSLMSAPEVLLVDEPTSALDHARGRDVVGLLREITHQQNVATALVTHDVQYLDLADRAVTMHDGRLRELAVSTAAG